jgi:hypothetical protein
VKVHEGTTFRSIVDTSNVELAILSDEVGFAGLELSLGLGEFGVDVTGCGYGRERKCSSDGGVGRIM